ncbi:hypothetical protein [Paenibacillus dendritiformis]|uniref:hypothetical protein n=1 Tax=Paenibacillus dendritiformis TaxID=130049 RepID=UPI00387E082D
MKESRNVQNVIGLWRSNISPWVNGGICARIHIVGTRENLQGREVQNHDIYKRETGTAKEWFGQGEIDVNLMIAMEAITEKQIMEMYEKEVMQEGGTGDE